MYAQPRCHDGDPRPLTVSVATASRMVGASPATVTHWCRTGVLKNAVKIGRSWFIRLEDLEALVGAVPGGPANAD